MKMILKYLLFILPAFLYAKAFAQSKDLGTEENQLIELHNKINARLNYPPRTKYEDPNFYKDSVDYFIAALEKEFTLLVTNNPKTIDYPFNLLRDSGLCHITTSGDKNVRVYNLDAWQLLTQIYQWRDHGKVYSKISRYVKDSSGLCREIFVVMVHGKRYYLPVISNIIWPSHAMQSIVAWHINGNKLETVNLFKNKLNKRDRIDVPFSFYNFAPGVKDTLLTFISYDDRLRKIYIPRVDQMGLFTKNYFIYEVKADYLEFTKIGDMKQERGMVNPPRK